MMGRIKAYIAIGAILALFVAGWAIRHTFTENQSLTATNAVLEARNEAITQEASRLANRPRTDDDVHVRLRRWADRIDRGTGPAKR